MLDFSIVIPAYNEKESLPILIDEIKSVCGERKYEILIIDDGSTDGISEWYQDTFLDDQKIRFFRLPKNHGKAVALSKGFKLSKGKYIITMDADLQDDPCEIPIFLKKLEAGADVVSGWKKRRRDPLGKTLPSKLFNFVVSRVSGIKLKDFNCGFKGYRRQVALSVELYGDRHRYIPVLAFWEGYRNIEEHTVHHRPRKYGHSKYGLSRLTNGLFDLVTLLFLNKYLSRPLHIFGFLGLLLIFLGGASLFYFAVLWYIKGALTLRPLLMLSCVSIILGVQIISMGLIAEMIVRRTQVEIEIQEIT